MLYEKATKIELLKIIEQREGQIRALKQSIITAHDNHALVKRTYELTEMDLRRNEYQQDKIIGVYERALTIIERITKNE